MAKVTENPALRLWSALYQCTPDGYVELRAIPNDKSSTLKPRREFVKTPEAALSFVEEWGHKTSQYGVYFGVAKRTGKGGKKSDVQCVPALWADIDTGKNGQDLDEVIHTIANLPITLRPSAVVLSGGGLHCYWFLAAGGEEPHDAVENANIAMMNLVGGDRVQDVTRILRVPGSWNTKRRKPVKVDLLWCYPWQRSSVATLIRAVEDFGMALDGNKLAKATAVAKKEAREVLSTSIEDRVRAMMARGKKGLVKDLDVMWRDHVRPGAPRGYIGIHEAQVVTTARLFATEHPEDAIVKFTLRKTREVMERADPEEFANWDMAVEEKTVRGMLATWVPKLKDMRAAERKEKRDAAKWQDKKKAKAARGANGKSS